jgi:hypothetical protein
MTESLIWGQKAQAIQLNANFNNDEFLKTLETNQFAASLH